MIHQIIMRKRILTAIIFFAAVLCGYAQRSEIGAFGGASFYLGELNPNVPFALSRPAGGIVYRYNITPRWAVRANISFAEVTASDAKTNKKDPRNLSLKSPITEISATVELNFLRIYTENGANHFAPYIFAGIGVFSFNPQAELDGKTYALQHLGTEGQGLAGQKKFYSLANVAIPFGLGFKYNVTKWLTLGIEWGMRYTFTDYLDDVSGNYFDNQTLLEERGTIVAALADRSEVLHEAGSGRGNVKTKDWYSLVGLTLTFRIGNEDKTCNVDYAPRRTNRKMGPKGKK